MPQEPMLYILLGAIIALAGSVLATWVQGSLTRRANAREATQGAIHELWRLFIDERESDGSATGITAGRTLGEAELLTATIADRRTRERVTLVTRLLRECELPEMEELSGMPADRARRALCAHVLDVLGTQLRNERLPALPESLQSMRRVESEALKIHAGGSPKPRTPEPANAPTPNDEPNAQTQTVSRSKVRRRPRTAQPETAPKPDSTEASPSST
ncbi:hypothetical protein J4H86_16850 [Spiractinospora alimapuensis]|uniref:hypothetical protein n=1 Tax=Spiractinospora alimapuensis TaxID=2820884 RepID=UPI001F236B6B|nr:hypothetical protein [Spiractinospora alimapuensis]QVQ50563.1 hypothetical protein J4H86_16850 [Spiractinospora alimapuensis]